MLKIVSTRSWIGLSAALASIAFSASVALAAGGGLDNPGAPSGGGGGAPGGGGGSSPVQCGKLGAVQSYLITVYTTRQGIGVTGTATNCSTGGGGRVPYTIVVTDTDPNPACTVNVPHYTSFQPVAPGGSIYWYASSTLIPCQGKDHIFNVQLLSGTTVLDTTTVSKFL